MAERTRRGRTSTRNRSSAPAEGLDRDYSEEEYREPSEGYNGPQPVKGLYPGKLVSINNHTKSGEDEPSSVRWGFELTGGETDGESVAGFRDYQYTNDDTTLWREHQIAVALGLIKPNGKLKMSFANILKKAKPCTLRIIRERYIPEDGGDPEWRGKISAVLSYRDITKKSSPRNEDSEEVADEEADDDWPEDPDELVEALEDLDLAELKVVAKEDFEVTVKRGMKADEIIDAILETLPEESEEEPEPPRRSSRRRAKEETEEDESNSDDDEEEKSSRRRGTSSRRRARGGSSEEPPF